MFGDSEEAKGFRRVIAVLFYIAICCLLTSPVVLHIFIVTAAWGPEPGVEKEPITNPSERFTELTGLPWPASATVEHATDDHGGFHGDGELRIVFHADPEELQAWRLRKPPWGGDDWSEGTARYHARSLPNVQKLAVASNDWLLCAEDFRISDIPWHNGRTLSVNLDSGRVELFWWDY